MHTITRHSGMHASASEAPLEVYATPDFFLLTNCIMQGMSQR